MAKLRVTADLLLAELFPDKRYQLEISDARYDADSGCVVLEITGPDVPDVENVTSVIQQYYRTTTFKPV